MMKTRYTILSALLTAAALLAVSCEKKLDIPQKGVLSTIEYYASDADAESALANMYAQYIENVAACSGNGVPQTFILNYAADDILAAGKNFTDHEGFRVFDEFSYDPANSVLKEAYQKQGSNRIQLPSRQELANMLGVQKYSVQRTLSEIEKEGIILLDGKHVEITNPTLLKV